jgi:hypothetical protein
MKRKDQFEFQVGKSYKLESGEDTGPIEYLPSKEGDDQPWYSRKLGWWFDKRGTSGTGMYDHPRKVIYASVVQDKRRRKTALGALSKAGKRVVAQLRKNPDAFGCQRDHAIALAAAITGDDADKISKALA